MSYIVILMSFQTIYSINYMVWRELQRYFYLVLNYTHKKVVFSTAAHILDITIYSYIFLVRYLKSKERCCGMNVGLQSPTPTSCSPTKAAHMVRVVIWNSLIARIPDGLWDLIRKLQICSWLVKMRGLRL